MISLNLSGPQAALKCYRDLVTDSISRTHRAERSHKITTLVLVSLHSLLAQDVAVGLLTSFVSLHRAHAGDDARTTARVINQTWLAYEDLKLLLHTSAIVKHNPLPPAAAVQPDTRRTGGTRPCQRYACPT